MIPMKLFPEADLPCWNGAPVVEEFKIQDEEIVSNSIHFKWLRVCQEFEKLTDFEKIRLEANPDLPDLENEVPEGL